MKLLYSTIFLCLTAVHLQAAEIRLAIVPADPRGAVAGELLTAEFSRAEHGVAVLERAEVERIRREQNLTARSSADFARLGQALGAQGVLVLDVFEQNGATNLTAKLIAVQPGVALGFQSYPWPLKDAGQWAGMVGKQFAGLLPKLGVLKQDAVPLSVLNLRSPLQTSEGRRLETDATTLLINRLISQREIFVLERQRMTLLGAEKELKDMQESPFWNGAYLLEGVVERGGATREAINVNARLVAPGRPSLTVSGKSDTGDLNALVDQLARDLIARLGKSTNSAPWNPAAEAKRYLQEAKWGMRWGNVPLAQAAADAAWTLGEHSLETALIRVNSYVQASSPPRSTGSRDGFNYPPGQASAASLTPIVTALENFALMTPALGTNAAASHDWQQAGLGALQTAAGQLWNFWHVTNEAAQASETLARLRSEAREVERVFVGDTAPSARTYATSLGTNLWSLRLAYGWVFADSMNDTLAEFRRLLPGLSREQLRQFREHSHPWLMPWAADERARAASAWSTFLDEQALSTNAAVALTARLIGIRDLSLRNRPAEADVFLRRQQAALTYVKHRRELLCQEPELVETTLRRLDWPVRQNGTPINFSYGMRTNFLHLVVTGGACHTDELLSQCFLAVPFDTNHLDFLLGKISEGVGTSSPAQSRRQFLRAFLRNTSNQYRWYVIERLFRTEDYTDPAEARATMNALNEFVASFRRMGADDKVLAVALNPAATLQAMLTAAEKPAAPPPAAITATPVVTNASDPKALVVSRWWQPDYKSWPTQEFLGSCVLQTITSEGHVWALVRGAYRFKVPTEYPDRYIFPERAFEQFFRINPADLSSVASPLHWDGVGGVLHALAGRFGWQPVSLFTPLMQFDLLNGVLYQHGQGKLSAWSPPASAWREIDVELPGRIDVTMRAIGGRLYFGSSDTLVEFNPSNAMSRVMASRRRNPPLVAEDQLPSFGRPTFLRAESNTVFILLGSTIHPWNSDAGRWLDPLAGPNGVFGGSLSPDRSSVLRWVGQPYEDQQLRRFHARSGDELLLEIKKQPDFSSVPMGRRAGVPTPRWKVPTGISVNPAVTAADGANLWCLDWKQRSLAYFESQWNEPLSVRLELQSVTFTNLTPAGMMPKVWFLPERNFVALSPQFANGLWIIQQTDLDRALAKVSTPRTPNKSVVAAPARSTAPDAAPAAAPVFADEAMPSASKIMRAYQPAGANGLGMDELVRAIKREPALEEYRSLIKNFQTTMLLIAPYDTNGNQRIDLPELDGMIKAGKPSLTREQFMERWDENNNDQFDPEEVRAATGRRRAR